MHEIEGTDYTTIGGHHAFKDTDPPTDLIATDMNMLLFEMLNAVLASNQALAASGALDQTAGWLQLTKAIRRLSRILRNATLAITGSTGAIVLDPDISFVQLTEASNHPGAVISLPDFGGAFPTDNHFQNENRLLAISNETTSVKFIQGGVDGPLVPVNPGCVVLFQAVLRTISYAFELCWLPVSGGFGDLIQSVAITTNPQTVTLAPLFSGQPFPSVLILTGTQAADSAVRLAEDDNNFPGMTLTVINNNTHRLRVGGAVTDIAIATGGGCAFRYDPTKAAGSKWTPLKNRSTDELIEGGTNLFFTNARAASVADTEADARITAALALLAFTMEARGDTGTTYASGLTAGYKLTNGLAFLEVPFANFTVAGADINIFLTGVSNGAIPSGLQLQSTNPDTFGIPITCFVNGVAKPCTIRGAAGGRLCLFPGGAGGANDYKNPNWTTGDKIQIINQTICYMPHP